MFQSWTTHHEFQRLKPANFRLVPDPSDVTWKTTESERCAVMRERCGNSALLCDDAQPRNDPRSVVHDMNRDKLKRARACRSDFHKSPCRVIRAGTFLTVKSSMRTPRSISFHVTGVDTVASARGRTE